MHESETAVSAIILAGGDARRLGGANKAVVEIGGTPLLELVLDAVSKVCEETLIVSRTPDAFGGYASKSVADLVPQTGPLGGLLTGLVASTNDLNFAVACDMPLLNTRFISYMIDRIPPEADMLIPRLNGFVEPLHALYRKSCIAPIKQRLEAGDRKLSSFFDLVNVTQVRREEIEPFDPHLAMFTNINCPEDIDTVERMLAHARQDRARGCNQVFTGEDVRCEGDSAGREAGQDHP